MTTDIFLFLILALIAVAAAVGMLVSKNAVYSALFLIINFGTVAVFYLMLGAPFIAMAQITVYAGAIMVLFLFVIMLLGAEHLRSKGKLPWQLPTAAVLGAALIAEAAVLIFGRSDLSAEIGTPSLTNGSPEEIGLMLFDKYLLPFEITGILLLAAMIGAIVLTRKDSSPQTAAEGEEQA